MNAFSWSRENEKHHARIFLDSLVHALPGTHSLVAECRCCCSNSPILAPTYGTRIQATVGFLISELHRNAYHFPLKSFTCCKCRQQTIQNSALLTACNSQCRVFFPCNCTCSRISAVGKIFISQNRSEDNNKHKSKDTLSLRNILIISLLLKKGVNNDF